MQSADVAWMLISTALVLMMTPALGFFYGGLVRAKNTLNTFAIITAALISGAIVERMQFRAYLAFLTLWGLAIYAPVAHIRTREQDQAAVTPVG